MEQLKNTKGNNRSGGHSRRKYRKRHDKKYRRWGERLKSIAEKFGGTEKSRHKKNREEKIKEQKRQDKEKRSREKMKRRVIFEKRPDKDQSSKN